MVICDIDNITYEKLEVPAQQVIDAQRAEQLQAVVHIRQLLAAANRPIKHKVA